MNIYRTKQIFKIIYWPLRWRSSTLSRALGFSSLFCARKWFHANVQKMTFLKVLLKEDSASFILGFKITPKKQPPEVFYKKWCKQFLKFHRKAPVLETLLNKGKVAKAFEEHLRVTASERKPWHPIWIYGPLLSWLVGFRYGKNILSK